MGARLAPRSAAGVDQSIFDWLNQGDPAVRWQAMRDLGGASRAGVRRERARVGSEGWGARLLAEQRPDGGWTGLYSPKWTSTHYTLLLLRSLGLPSDDERARRGCAVLLDGGARPDGGLNYSSPSRRSETCISGMGLAIQAAFGVRDRRLHDIVQYLTDVQMPDGGWNCRWWRGDSHSSFHTTISALEGLLEYARLFPRRAALAEQLQAEGREFLLRHRLFRSHRTGEVVSERMTRFTFPPHWHYDVLRALDYFREAGSERDARLEDAIALVEKRRQPDGRWRGAAPYTGRTYVAVDGTGPSRWNTLRSLRILDWWQRGGA